MKSLTEHLWFEIPTRRGFVNITDTVEKLVRKSGVKEGLALINAMHISASVFINDNEAGLHHDYEVWLEKLAPHEPTGQYHHNRTGEDNADVGAIATQSYANIDYGPNGLGWLARGSSARETLDRLTAADEGRDRRQAGIVDARGTVAAHTGTSCNAWAGHIEGTNFCAQGNILASEEVVQAMARAFVDARAKSGSELADWLMAALAAGQARAATNAASSRPPCWWFATKPAMTARTIVTSTCASRITQRQFRN